MNSAKYLTIFILITLSSACATNSREKVTVTNVSLDGTWTIIKADCLDKCQDRFKTAAQTYVGKGIEIDGTYLEFPQLHCFTTELAKPQYPNKEKLIADDSRLQKLTISQEEVVLYSVECGRYAFDFFWSKDTNTAFIVANTTGVYLTLRKASNRGAGIRISGSQFHLGPLAFPEPIEDVLRSGALVFKGESYERKRSEQRPPLLSVEMGPKVTVFYGTNRKPTNSEKQDRHYGDERSQTIELGSCLVSIPPNHEEGKLESPTLWEFVLSSVGRDAYSEKEHVMLLQTTLESSETDFLRKTHARDKEILVYVHGWNNSFAEAARRTAQIARDLGFDDGRAFFYSWPSSGTYPKAETQEELARPRLKTFLLNLANESGANKIHLIAHSLGTRLLVNTLKEIIPEHPSGDRKFNQVFLAAPDITVDVFKEQIAPRIRGGVEKITVYASIKDKALALSKEFHGEPRLGEFNEDIGPIDDIYLIDASALGEDMLGHSYHGERPFLEEIRAVLSGIFPEKRGLIKRVLKKATYWMIKPLP